MSFSPTIILNMIMYFIVFENNPQNHPTDWASFVKAGRDMFDVNRGCRAYELIDLVDQIYRLAQPKFPVASDGTEAQVLLPMCFMLSHRSFLGAVTVAASGQPEDSPAITRRALEAANVCLAAHIEPENFYVWRSTPARMDRWKKRLDNEKPKAFSPQYKGVENNSLYNEIKTAIAVISDISVHFTPEHVLGYEFEQSTNHLGTTICFGVSERRFVMEILSTIDFHRAILQAFDYCANAALSADPHIANVAERAWTLLKELLVLEAGSQAELSLGGTWWGPEA